MHSSLSLQNQRKPVSLILLLLSSLLTLFRTMPLFQGYFSAYTELLLIIVCFLFLFPIERITFNNMVSIFVVAALFFFFQTFCQESTWFLNVYNILHGSFKAVLLYFLLNTTESNRRILKYLFWVLIISISITQVTSIIGLEQYPLLARFSVNSDGARIIAATYGPDVSAAKLNVTGYGTAYLAPVYTSLLFALMKRKELNPILFVCHVILSFTFIFATQFTIALLLYTITVIALILTDVDTKKMIAVSVIAVLVVLIFSDSFSVFFELLAENVKHRSVSDRFLELSSFFAGESIEGTDLNIRLEDYRQSFEVFIENILWGGKLVGEHSGGHSAILDYLSQCGIWGLFIMVAFFKMIYSKLLMPFTNNSYVRYINISFVFFAIASILNPMFKIGIVSCFIFALAGFCATLFENKDDALLKNQVV